MQGKISQDGLRRVGEVVEASTTAFTTQCYELYQAPPLGTLVRCGERNSVYGIVYEVTTRSMDPTRHPIPRGQDEDTEEAVYFNNPQLNRLLLTEVRSLVAGYQSDVGLRRYLAPLPPRIHSFVYCCSKDEVHAFSSSLEFMPILLAAPAVPAPDDVITSFLRQASVAHQDPEQFLLASGKELAVLLGGQMQRLNQMLRRLSP